MRVARVMGLPTVAEDGGVHNCNHFPFSVVPVPAEWGTPPSSTPGDYVQFPTGPVAWCVGDPIFLFGRIAQRKIDYRLIGQYYSFESASLESFDFNNIGLPNIWSVPTPDFTSADERGLPHSRWKYLQASVPFSESPLGDLHFGATYILGHDAIGSSIYINNTIEYFAVPGMDLFDFRDGEPLPDMPSVFYSTEVGAFYMAFLNTVEMGVEVSYLDSETGVTQTYPIKWTPGPAPADPGTIRINGVDVDIITVDDAATSSFPEFIDLSGYFSWPDGFGSLSSFTLDVLPPDEDGYFEFRDEDGLNPIYDKDTGDQLISPLPVTMRMAT